MLVGMTRKLPPCGNLRRADSVRPSIKKSGGPHRALRPMGSIPTNEELMIAMDTAALVQK